MGSARYAERQLEVIFGSGYGGQKLFIIPEVNMVVVVMSKVFGNKGGQERATDVRISCEQGKAWVKANAAIQDNVLIDSVLP